MKSAASIDDHGGLDLCLRRLADSDDDHAWASFLDVEGGFLRSVARDHAGGDILIEDVVQESLIRIRHSLSGYASYSDADARGWLRRVVRHVAMDLTAAERSRHQREQRTADAAPASHDPRSTPVPDPILAERMESSLRRLPVAQHRVINLHYYEGLSFDDIASRLRLTPHHVHVLHGRALGKLRQRLVSAGRPALSIAALIALLQTRGEASEASAAATMSGSATVSAAKTSVSAVLGWTAAALVGVSLAVAWYIVHHRTPVAPVTAAAAPAPAPAPAMAVPTATPTQAFIRRFQEAHPNWRLTDGGRRLGDGSVWSLRGPWNIAQDQAQARINVVNPSEQLQMAGLTLGPVIDPARTARLMVGTLTMATRTQRSGFRLTIMPDPQRPSPWAGFQWDVALTPDLMDKSPVDSTPATVRRYPIGLAVDAEQVHCLLDDRTRSEPRMPGEEVCFALNIYGRWSPESQVITFEDVQVYEAEAPR